MTDDEVARAAAAPRRSAARRWRAGVREVLHRRRDRQRHRLAVRAGPRAARAPSRSGPTRRATRRSSRASRRRGFQCATHAIGDRGGPRGARRVPRRRRARPASATASSTSRRCATPTSPRFAAEGVAALDAAAPAMGLTSPTAVQLARRPRPGASDRAFRMRGSCRLAARSSRSAPTGRWSALDPRRGPRLGAAAAAPPGERDRTPYDEQALTALQRSPATRPAPRSWAAPSRPAGSRPGFAPTSPGWPTTRSTARPTTSWRPGPAHRRRRRDRPPRR